MENERIYALKSNKKFLSYNPADGTYREVKNILELKVWDWMNVKDKYAWFGSQSEPVGPYQIAKLSEKQKIKIISKN